MTDWKISVRTCHHNELALTVIIFALKTRHTVFLLTLGLQSMAEASGLVGRLQSGKLNVILFKGSKLKKKVFLGIG
jgi:hypothetical protein